MHFVPFILGIAVGTVVTYIAKDDSSKQALKDTGGKITGGFSTLTEKATGMFKKGEESAENVEVADVDEAAVPAS